MDFQADDTLPPDIGHPSETPPMFETRVRAQSWEAESATPPTVRTRDKIVMPLPPELTPPTVTTRDAAAFVGMRSLLDGEAEPRVSHPASRTAVAGWTLAIVAVASMGAVWWWMALG